MMFVFLYSPVNEVWDVHFLFATFKVGMKWKLQSIFFDVYPNEMTPRTRSNWIFVQGELIGWLSWFAGW